MFTSSLKYSCFRPKSMVATISSCRRASNAKASRSNHSSFPAVVARRELKQPRDQNQGIFSELATLAEDNNKTPSATERCNKDKTGMDIDVCGQDVSNQQTPQSNCRNSTTNDKTPHHDSAGKEMNPLSESKAPLSEEQASSHRSAVTLEICHEEGYFEEFDVNTQSEKQGDDPLVESGDPYAWLIQTSEVIVIDPEDTIPLTCIREVTEAGILKLERAIQGEEGSGLLKGISSAVSQAVVVLIPDDQLHIVRSYFVKVKGLSEENAFAISISKKWYGVVDGAHRRVCLLKRVKKYPDRYKGKGWIVIRVDWKPLDILRAFARARNELQTGDHIVDFTVYDIFKNLKKCATELAVREGLVDGSNKNRGYVKKVADEYCGGVDTANKLTRQLAGIAIALSWPVINMMGEILNKEYPHAAIAVEDPTTGYDPDTRMCRNLLSRSTFRGATRFKTQLSEEDQLNTLRRLQNIASQRKYKPVSTRELETQARNVILSRCEVEKMEKRLQGHQWPAEMEAIKQTLLTTTQLDDNVEKNKDNDQLLPELEEQWKNCFPLAAELEEANRFLRTITIDNNLDLSPPSNHIAEIADKHCVSLLDPPSCAPPEEYPRVSQQSPTIDDEQPSTYSDRSDSAARDIGFEASGDASNPQDDMSFEVDPADISEVLVKKEEKLCPLEQLSVRAENKNWREFQMTLHDEDLFDFIYADPKQSLSASDLKEGLCTEFKDERKISEFAKFCRITLRPGCYCFVFVTAAEHDTWVSAFQKQGMKVMASPFMVIPSPASARVTRLKDLPQSLGELAVLARTPGKSSRFTINFSRSYSRIDCSYSRKFGVIDHVPRCNNALRAHNSRAEIRPRERHPDTISEVIETFCPPRGVVLDPFAGAFTTGILCISSQRACVLLENDRFCFEIAIRRLEKLCRDQVLSVDEAQSKSLEKSNEEAF